MRPGARLGIDVGTVRIGVARTDPSALLAVPVETVPRGPGDVERIVALAVEHDVIEIVVGLPISLSGKAGVAAEAVRAFARELATAAPMPVRLVDERLSTVSASQGLRSAGRSAKSSRAVIDQAAAVVIVQYAVDSERASGRAPGSVVQE